MKNKPDKRHYIKEMLQHLMDAAHSAYPELHYKKVEEVGDDWEKDNEIKRNFWWKTQHFLEIFNFFFKVQGKLLKVIFTQWWGQYPEHTIFWRAYKTSEEADNDTFEKIFSGKSYSQANSVKVLVIKNEK